MDCPAGYAVQAGGSTANIGNLSPEGGARKRTRTGCSPIGGSFPSIVVYTQGPSSSSTMAMVARTGSTSAFAAHSTTRQHTIDPVPTAVTRSKSPDEHAEQRTTGGANSRRHVTHRRIINASGLHSA
ncbi:hypothetical protein ACFWPH_00765 [Nocardia sp. NPDC058499]|uniref:hypothetical protein n=1 Tax=Nocardia sp. NPDC058499 TaxID=3346530 RepID=UPI00364A5E1B